MATPTEEPDNPSEKQAKLGEEEATTAPPQGEQKKTAKKTELAILNFVIKYLRLVGGALLIWFMGWHRPIRLQEMLYSHLRLAALFIISSVFICYFCIFIHSKA